MPGLDRAIRTLPNGGWKEFKGEITCSLPRRTSCSRKSGPERRWASTLRRYWQPIGGASELDDNPIKAIRLLGEDLVLYKDQGGRYGLIDRHCPHRRADLSYGFVEEDRHPLQLSRLADGRGRPLHRAAVRRHRQSELARQGALQHQGLSGEGVRRTAVRLYGAAAGARTAGLGAVHLGERLPRGGAVRHSLQLVPVPGELLRSRAFRVDARQLDGAAEGPERPLCQQAPQAEVRGVRATASSTSACARIPTRAIRTGPSGASRCGRTASISATTSNGACRSTTRTRSRWRGSSCACRRAASPTCRQRCRPGGARSRTTTAAGSPATSSIRTSSAGSGRATIADRTKETLGASDLGIAMIRKRFFEDIDAMARGEEPKGVIRNPNVARCVDLPFFQKKESIGRHHARRAREVSAAQGAAERLPPLLRPAAADPPRLRGGDGDREVVREVAIPGPAEGRSPNPSPLSPIAKLSGLASRQLASRASGMTRQDRCRRYCCARPAASRTLFQRLNSSAMN